MSVLTVDVPEELEAALNATGYTSQRLADEARQYLAVALFARKILSLEQAAQLAKMSLWTFIPFLGEQGVAVADYDGEEVQSELETARWLAGKQQK